jgi:hypothetical protein
LSATSGPKVDLTLYSVFTSRKKNAMDEKFQQTSMLPSNFQVYAKIEEEARKDSFLTVSFLLTLNDAKGSVTFEFRGSCTITGSSADFESLMEVHKGSRVPKILDSIYQRLYPQIFMLAGMTTSSYPQSIGVSTEMVLTEPIQVHPEAHAIAEQKKPELSEKPASLEKPEAPQPAMVKTQKKPSTSDIDNGSTKTAAAK